MFMGNPPSQQFSSWFMFRAGRPVVSELALRREQAERMLGRRKFLGGSRGGGFSKKPPSKQCFTRESQLRLNAGV